MKCGKLFSCIMCFFFERDLASDRECIMGLEFIKFDLKYIKFFGYMTFHVDNLFKIYRKRHNRINMYYCTEMYQNKFNFAKNVNAKKVTFIPKCTKKLTLWERKCASHCGRKCDAHIACKIYQIFVAMYKSHFVCNVDAYF